VGTYKGGPREQNKDTEVEKNLYALWQKTRDIGKHASPMNTRKSTRRKMKEDYWNWPGKMVRGEERHH